MPRDFGNKANVVQPGDAVRRDAALRELRGDPIRAFQVAHSVNDFFTDETIVAFDFDNLENLGTWTKLECGFIQKEECRSVHKAYGKCL